MTITEARRVLEQDAVGLTDQEVQEIIDWLDKMADIAIEAVEKKNLCSQTNRKAVSTY